MVRANTIRQDIEQAIRDCLGSISVSINNCRLGIYDCGSVKEMANVRRPRRPTKNIDVHGAGAYVFFDESTIYYVGEANDVARRLLNEHCEAHIGGSEGVVRFLMQYLDEVCSHRNKWIGLDAKGREDAVKDILKNKISRLKIYIVTCYGLNDEVKNGRRIKNRLRASLEDCLINRLKPILQKAT